ncbi:ABC transporter ATP-binding protein [Proteinivorax hydrogeniformans]|uniref:ABC transporter ATP-binding protein n=1 Tax=Proteinivorax hydrogeniformans TaxID=1826727 RepID=A0AAU8HVN4_9FIRM
MGTINFRNVSKVYGKNRAVDNIDATIYPNKIYGLLGRNGAGKTTMLNMLTNKIFPTTGTIKINGESVSENQELLSKVFYMMEKNIYPEAMKVKEVFKWTSKFYPNFELDYANNLADKFELNIDKKVKELSTGYTSIFKVIVALASNAETIIFDEPVLGLDAYHRDMLYKEILSNYIKKPKTMIISTHLIEEVADILEEVIIIKNGKLIKHQAVEELLKSAYTVSGKAEKVDQFANNKKIIGEETLGNFKAITIMESYKDEALAKKLDVEISKPELQKLFISLSRSKGGSLK